MNRRLAAVVLVAVLAAAGCAGPGLGGGGADSGADEPNYDWDASADATITIGPNSYQAVYHVSNRSTMAVYRFHRLNNERSVDLRDVRFRYPNGTVVGPEAIDIEKTRSATEVALPAEEGTLAMTVPKNGKRVRIPRLVEGSYEVVLPPDARVQYFLLGRVSPGGYASTLEGDQVHLFWESVRDDRVVVRYYLVRDLVLFSALLGIAGVALVFGTGYFYLQLRQLRQRRESVAIDLGDDSGPP